MPLDKTGEGCSGHSERSVESRIWSEKHPENEARRGGNVCREEERHKERMRRISGPFHP